MTLTFAFLTLCSCHAWRVTWPTLPPSMMTLRLSVLELRVVTFPIGYHWKCVCGHCTCAESRDLWVGGEIRLPDPDLPIHYTTLVALRWIWLKLYVKIIHGPVLKTHEILRMREITWSVKRCPKCLIAVVFVDVDLQYWTSKVEHIISFMAIFSHISTSGLFDLRT